MNTSKINDNVIYANFKKHNKTKKDEDSWINIKEEELEHYFDEMRELIQESDDPSEYDDLTKIIDNLIKIDDMKTKMNFVNGYVNARYGNLSKQIFSDTLTSAILDAINYTQNNVFSNYVPRLRDLLNTISYISMMNECIRKAGSSDDKKFRKVFDANVEDIMALTNALVIFIKDTFIEQEDISPFIIIPSLLLAASYIAGEAPIEDYIVNTEELAKYCLPDLEDYDIPKEVFEGIRDKEENNEN